MLDITFENIDAVKAIYDPDLVDKALATSLNRVSAKAKTLVSKQVRENNSVKAGDVSKALSVSRARKGESSAVLLYAGSRLGLHKFAPRVRSVVVKPKNNRYGRRRKQVRVRVHKKDDLVSAMGPNGNAGFMAPDGRIYARLGAKRETIVSLAGPSIAAMVDQSEVIEPMNKMLSTELNAEFAHNLDFFINKQVGLA